MSTTTDIAEPIIDAALLYCASGFSLVPIDCRTKQPNIKWKPHQATAADEATIHSWARTGLLRDAVAVVCGAVSGGLLIVDFDVPDFYDRWREAVGDLADGLPVVRTGGGGNQVLLRCPSPGANRKLAWSPCEANEDGREIAIETRGEGGYAVLPPSRHPTGNLYDIIDGDPSKPPLVSQAHADALLDAARKLCQAPLTRAEIEAAKRARPSRQGREKLNGDTSIIDAFNARNHVRDLLIEKGYRPATRGDMLVRPGKDGSAGSVLIHEDKNTSFHFSTNDPLNNGHQRDAFDVFCHYWHAGDVKAAVRAAADELGLKTHQQKATTGNDWASRYANVDTGERQRTAAPDDSGFRAGTKTDDDQTQEQLSPIDAGALCREFPALRPVIIDGLLRETETANLISTSKSRKTWTMMALALCVATGRTWLGLHQVQQGNVLYIDAELHPNTFARRLHSIAQAMGILSDEFATSLKIINLRGRLRDIYGLAPVFAAIPNGMYRLVILDALYRLIPAGVDENSNSEMTPVYNAIDRYAELTGAAFAIVHHSSKGGQAEKSITDVGAGAGAQSRATDSHIILRDHEEDDVVVMEAAVRSFPPPPPVCLRWTFPVWTVAKDLDPADLRTSNRRKKRIDPEQPAAEQKIEWNPKLFASTFITTEPKPQDTILARAKLSMSGRKAADLLSLAVEDGFAHRWHPVNRKDPIRISSVQQPVTDGGGKDQ
jgi:hypothetical protein